MHAALNAENKEVFRQAIADLSGRWRLGKKNPDALKASGIFRVKNKGYSINERGEYVRSNKGMLVQFRPNIAQQLMQKFRETCRAQGVAPSGMIIKNRGLGVSLDIQLSLLCLAMTTSHVRGIIVGRDHDQASRNILQEITRAMFDNVPLLPNIITKGQNAHDRLAFECDDPAFPDFHVTGSMIQAYGPTEKEIEEVRGSRALFMHFSETDFWSGDYYAVKEALQSVWLSEVEGAEMWEESTINGEGGGPFVTEYKTVWEAQGGCNFWLPGFRPGMAGSTAMFFPGHLDQAASGELMPGVTWSQFKALLDDEEKMILETGREDWNGVRDYLDLRISNEEIENRLLRFLAFRRDRLESLYDRGIVKLTPADKINTREAFQRGWPSRLEDILMQRQQEDVFSADEIVAMESTVRPPIWEGEINRDPDGSIRLDPCEGGALRVWRWPWECSPGSIVSLSLDPHVGADSIDPLTGIDTQYDSTFAVSFDWSDGEQVLEYESQELSEYVKMELWNIARFLSNRTHPTEEVRRQLSTGRSAFIHAPFNAATCPFFNMELQNGDVISSYFVLDRQYPRHRLYERRDRQGGTTAGALDPRNYFYQATTATKYQLSLRLKDAIKEMERSVKAGFLERGEWADQRIIRSARLLAQAKNLVYRRVKNTRMIQAKTKGKRDATSKDDGMIALGIDCLSSSQVREVRKVPIRSRRDQIIMDLAAKVRSGKRLTDKEDVDFGDEVRDILAKRKPLDAANPLRRQSLTRLF